jgi:hypothetical protein
MSRLNGSLETRQESMPSATHNITQATTTFAIKVFPLRLVCVTKLQRRFKLVKAWINAMQGRDEQGLRGVVDAWVLSWLLHVCLGTRDCANQRLVGLNADAP